MTSIGNSNRIAREYLDSLLIETRYMDSENPRADFELYGAKAATPIMTAALSHLDHFMFPGAAEALAKGASDAGAILWYGMAEEDEIERLAAFGAPMVEIIKPYADREKILRKIAHAEKLKKENKVINREGWLEAQETSLETDGIPVEQHNGNVVRIVNEVAERVNKALCTSYFTRDERLALPSASAAFTQPPTPATTQPQPCDCAANVL